MGEHGILGYTKDEHGNVYHSCTYIPDGIELMVDSVEGDITPLMFIHTYSNGIFFSLELTIQHCPYCGSELHKPIQCDTEGNTGPRG